jgi:murein L,D-transpeptidase YafK
MQSLKIFLLTFMLIFTVSCTTAQKVPTPKIKKVLVIKPKPKSLSLEKSLKRIGAHIGDPIFIRIFKKEKILELFVKVNDKYKLCKTYPICAYSGELGPKLKQGDKQSPEGFYSITKKQLKSRSKYHLAINIGFPNQYDKYQKRTGTYLMIHGKCSSTGCYAMRNKPIEEIFMMAENALENGQSKFDVHIFPFRMTKQNMAAHRTSKWYPFWVNLKLGHDIFEKYKIVPIIRASKENYRFFMKKTKDRNGFKTLL